MKPQIVVVGSSNSDLVVQVPHFPGPEETVLGDDFEKDKPSGAQPSLPTLEEVDQLIASRT